MAITLITNEKTLSASIASVARRGANLDLSIWIAGASSVAHAKDHGDLTLFGKLLNSMPNGSRVQTLIAWAQAAAPVSASKDSKTGAWKVSIDKKREGFESDRSDWDVDFLKETAWYSYKKLPSKKLIDLPDLIKMIEKVAEGEDTETRETSEQARLFAKLALKAIDLGQKTQAQADECRPAQGRDTDTAVAA